MSSPLRRQLVVLVVVALAFFAEASDSGIILGVLEDVPRCVCRRT